MAEYNHSSGSIQAPAERVGAIVVAAGQSSRMQGTDKIFAQLGGQPVIYHSIQALQESPLVTAITLVLSYNTVQKGQALVERNRWSKVIDVCAGGERRQDSVSNGLNALSHCDWIIVHDGARPFIEQRMISEGLADAYHTGAAIAGVPAKDTIKRVGDDMNVIETLPRQSLWIVQTPQIFRRELLVRAHQQIVEDVTDDASMVERLGVKVRMYMGSYRNIKITTPEDLYFAEAIIDAKSSAARDTH